MDQDVDTTLKLKIYESVAQNGHIPDAAQLSRLMNWDDEVVRTSLSRLSAKRLIVPDPDDMSRIRMAPPFSGIPTSFPVRAGNRLYYANCVWDAFGIAAALHQDAIIEGADGHTSEPITLQVNNGRPVPSTAVAHFAVPAALWWQDIIYT